MRSLRSALIFIGAAGVAFGILMVIVIFSSDLEETAWIDSVLTLLPAWSFIGTGLFAWWRRPNNRTGSLMVLVGFGWLLVPLSLSDVPALFGISMFTTNIAWVLLALLLLSFPSGRLEARSHRLLVWLFVLDAVVLTSITGVVSGPDLETFNCDTCVTNPVELSDSPGLARALDTVATLGGVLLLLALIVVLVRRYRSLGPTNRSAVRPVLGAGAASVLAIGVLVTVAALEVGDTVQQAVFVIAVTLMAAVPFAFLIGLLRSKFTSAGAVSELIASLGDTSTQNLNIRDALAKALGDDSLEFAYWLPDRGVYVDSEGHTVALPEIGSGRRWSSVEHDGELIAAIAYDDTLQENQDLIKSTGTAAALALRNQRLDAELRAHVEELRASRARIVEASDAARRTLERNLHDGAQQHLVSTALTLRIATNKIDDDPDAAKQLLAEAAENLAEATTELRELARGIHPAILTDRGLGAALAALAARSPVIVHVGELPAERPPAAIESAAYFVAAESLTNMVRYSKASLATIELTQNDDAVVIEISDNGIGGADINSGSGLRGLQDRVAALDGKFFVVSEPGSGTTIRAEFPCAS